MVLLPFFLTISPCDFVSFRIKLYATSDCNKLPSLDYTNEDLIAGWTLSSKLQNNFRGANAIEFQNFLQMFIEDYLGCDVKKKKKI